ncbi:MAG: hypothetical protein ACREQ9_15850 [Candidatus Binatia bacterium]
MPRIAEIFSKPETFRAIDAISRYRAQFDLDSVIRELRSSRLNLVDIARAHRLIANEEEERHLREHLLNERRRGWWQHVQPIEPVIRKALLKTVELVKERDLPVDAYWVCTGTGRSAPFAVTISASEQQITLIFLTPAPPGVPRRGGMGKESSIWIVQRAGRKVDARRVNRVRLGGRDLRRPEARA